MKDQKTQKPSLLAGLKVVEMSHVMAAPTCGLMLADMGAEVIKVERMPAGDDLRRSAPLNDGYSVPFAMMNRNKRSFAVNTKGEEGRAALKDLIAKADIFIENYRPGAMAHFGVDYDTMKAINPRLIYCSLSGFGATGPYSSRGGFDLVAQGMSGLMSITGEGPGRPPVKVGSPATDISAGILAAMGILAAVNQRHNDGEGQFVDTSLFEAGIMLTYWQSAIFFGSGEIPGAMGSAHPLMAPYQAFQTADGWVNVGAANQANWLKLTKCLDAEELADDPRFKDGNDRMASLTALVDVLTAKFMVRGNDEWLARLEEFGIPAGPVLDVKQVSEDPQTIAREMVREVSGDRQPMTRVLGHPVKFSASSTEISCPAPRFGQHSREILAEIGYETAQIDKLIEAENIHAED